MFQSEENEWCFGCNRCIICDEHYKHRRVWIQKPNDDLPSLKEYISHPYCEKLVNAIKKRKKELEILEEELFMRKYCISEETFKLSKK